MRRDRAVTDGGLSALGGAEARLLLGRVGGELALDLVDEIQVQIEQPSQMPCHDQQVLATMRIGLGTGLGLATARRIIVDRHEGSLAFDSEPGRTTFHVVLPIPPGA